MTSDPTFTRAARYAGVAVLLAYVIAAIVWRPIHAPGSLFEDFMAYYAGGRSWLEGGDPYGLGVWSTERLLPGLAAHGFALIPFVGPPVSLPLWGTLASLPFAAASALWALVLVGCMTALLLLPSRVLARPLHARAALPLMLLALTFGPILDGFALGQPALPAAVAVGASIYCASRGRWAGAGVAAFLAATLKPNLALILIAALRCRSAFLAYGVAAAAWVAGNLLVGGPSGIRHYAAIVGQQSASEAWYAFQFTSASVAHGYGLPTAYASVAGHAVEALAVVLIAAGIVWSRAGLIEGCAIAAAGWPFVSSYVHEVDFIVVLLPALIIVYRARGGVWSLGATGAVLVAIDAFALAESGAGIALAAVTATVSATQFAAFAPAVPSRQRVLPVLLGLGMLVIGAASPANRLPLWPEALPPHFSVPPGLTAAQVWERELSASHVIGSDPRAAFLRTLTLLGAGCVAVALVLDARRRIRPAVRPG